MPHLLPLFLNLSGRDVLLVGGGPVAAGKLQSLVDAGARVRVVAPDIIPQIEATGVDIVRRGFEAPDLDGAWLVVAAANPDVNRQVAAAAEGRRVFVNAVDDPPNASAYLGGVLRRDGVTMAVSTSGAAPALAALLREAIDAVLPEDLGAWMAEARQQRAIWRRDLVPMAARKPRLLQALNDLYGLTTDVMQGTRGGSRDPRANDPVAEQTAGPAAVGHVSLVGAGPGDPALLTRKAIGRLRAADLVLYDALIDDRILRYARKAQRFFVGKRAGRHALTQAAIHGVMIRAARRGRRVVRLKGGDPFVFGRGGEEMLALMRAGVPCDVVPGVTSALAAPALAGIPLTHRGVSAAFLVVSGHDVDAFAATVGQVPANEVTLVVLMGLKQSAALGRVLVDRGWSGATPVAVIFKASVEDQEVRRGTLGGLASGMVEDGDTGPATIVIGDVVNVAVRAARHDEGTAWSFRTAL